MSNFGNAGNHLFEHNRIHNNSVGVFFESAWDLGSTVRYNLIFNNYHGSTTPAMLGATVSSDGLLNGLVESGSGCPSGGFLFKDMVFSPVAIYNNTFYNNTGNFFGHWKIKPTIPVTVNGTNAAVNFRLAVEGGTLNNPKIKFARWIAPLPVVTDSRGNSAPAIPVSSIHDITPPATPLTVNSANQLIFVLPAALEATTTHGFFELTVEGTDASGNTVTSDVGFLPYRKVDAYIILRYTAGNGGIIVGSATQTIAPGSNGTTVVAIADEGYVFTGWSDGVATAERTDRGGVASFINVTASFTPQNPVTLRYNLGVGGESLIGGAAVQTVPLGLDGELVYVVSKDGYEFLKWSDGSTDNPRTDKNVQGDIEVVAYYIDPEGNISVKSPGREVSPGVSDVVVAPAGLLACEFAVGPNPVSKSSGVLNFYLNNASAGAAANGVLTVYDASGSAVSKIRIGALRATPAQPCRRPVGSWDLTDRRGRAVAEGAYLVKGAVNVNGRKEKVLLVVGVR